MLASSPQVLCQRHQRPGPDGPYRQASGRRCRARPVELVRNPVRSTAGAVWAHGQVCGRAAKCAYPRATAGPVRSNRRRLPCSFCPRGLSSQPVPASSPGRRIMLAQDSLGHRIGWVRSVRLALAGGDH